MQNLKDVRADIDKCVKGLFVFLNCLDDFDFVKRPDGSVSLIARLGAEEEVIDAEDMFRLVPLLIAFVGKQPIYKWKRKNKELSLWMLMSDVD